MINVITALQLVAIHSNKMLLKAFNQKQITKRFVLARVLTGVCQTLVDSY